MGYMAFKKRLISVFILVLFAVVLCKKLMKFRPIRYSVIALAFFGISLSGYVLVKSIRQSEAHQPEQVNLNHPNLVVPATLALPQMLDDKNRALYQEAFAAQRNSDWELADRAIAQLTDKSLLGHVLAERYLGDGYYSRYKELVRWLDAYGDLPQAQDIRKLSQKRKPTGEAERGGVVRSKPSLKGYGDDNGLAGSIRANYTGTFDWNGRDKARQVWENVFNRISEGQLTSAEEYLLRDDVRAALRPREYDVALWAVANGFYAYGKDEESYNAAVRAAHRSGAAIPGIYWTAGLSSWRLGKIKEAGKFFASMAESENVSPWEHAAAAYWAHRSYKRLDQLKKAGYFLEVASQYPRTFYGILARYEREESLELVDAPQEITAEEQVRLMALPAVQRMVALAEVEEYDILEQELRYAFPALPKALRPKLLSLATGFRTPAPLLRMGRVLEHQQPDTRYDFATYPIPRWEPEGGYDIEPALVFALIRQESGFNPRAQSHAGASGLMQLMPTTAKYIQDTYKLEASAENSLLDPSYNLTLGQHYIRHLLEMEEVNGNLFYLVSSYNAGPGNLRRWKKEVAYQDDPLLFIESIPTRETRNYIEQVMANYWMYRSLLGKGTPSLRSLAAGVWPEYNGTASQVAFLDDHVNIFDY